MKSRWTLPNEERLYYVWAAIKQRCNNPKSKLFEHYGGRGIKVCEEWNHLHGYIAFYDWAVRNGYAVGLTIDRIDNDGPYSPANCRFVPREVNLRNRRMTPKWKAAIDKMRSTGGCHVMTPKKMAALKANMAKARAVANAPEKLALKLEHLRAGNEKLKAMRAAGIIVRPGPSKFSGPHHEKKLASSARSSVADPKLSKPL